MKVFIRHTRCRSICADLANLLTLSKLEPPKTDLLGSPKQIDDQDDQCVNVILSSLEYSVTRNDNLSRSTRSVSEPSSASAARLDKIWLF